jgi:hypothetical protein
VEENRTTMCDNKDLPNLQGAEAAAILKTLVDCSGQTPNTDVGSIAIEILEGRVYPEHNEVDRTARVHLLVSLKSLKLESWNERPLSARLSHFLGKPCSEGSAKRDLPRTVCANVNAMNRLAKSSR